MRRIALELEIALEEENYEKAEDISVKLEEAFGEVCRITEKR